MNIATTHADAKSYAVQLLLTEWWKQDDGGWIVRVWGLPGCVTQGRDEREARVGIIACYTLFVESCNDDGEPLPWSLDGWEAWPKGELHWVKVEHSERVA